MHGPASIASNISYKVTHVAKAQGVLEKNGPVPGMRTGSTGGPPPYWNIFIPSNLVGRKHNLRLSFRNAFAVCNVAFAREIYPVSFREPMFSQISIFLLSRSHVLLSRAIMLQDFKLQSTAYVISNTYLYTAFTYDPLHLVCVSMWICAAYRMEDWTVEQAC